MRFRISVYGIKLTGWKKGSGTTLTLQQIKYALSVDECGSFSKASRKLFVSQPTLTNAVRELESEVGMCIFERTPKGVNVTDAGREFLEDIRKLQIQSNMILNKYRPENKVRRKFSVCSQHYSFVNEAFVSMVKKFGASDYKFSILEVPTLDVMNYTSDGICDMGILYKSTYNSDVISRMLKERQLDFHPLAESQAYVFLSKNHPLAGRESLSYQELQDYPCLHFYQGEHSSNYLAEEILSDKAFRQTIYAADRGTMITLLKNLNGYTLCSGIFKNDFTDENFIIVPFREDDENHNQVMTIGYVIPSGTRPGDMGSMFIDEMRTGLSETIARVL